MTGSGAVPGLRPMHTCHAMSSIAGWKLGADWSLPRKQQPFAYSSGRDARITVCSLNSKFLRGIGGGESVEVHSYRILSLRQLHFPMDERPDFIHAFPDRS